MRSEEISRWVSVKTVMRYRTDREIYDIVKNDLPKYFKIFYSVTGEVSFQYVSGGGRLIPFTVSLGYVKFTRESPLLVFGPDGMDFLALLSRLTREKVQA